MTHTNTYTPHAPLQHKDDDRTFAVKTVLKGALTSGKRARHIQIERRVMGLVSERVVTS